MKNQVHQIGSLREKLHRPKTVFLVDGRPRVYQVNRKGSIIQAFELLVVCHMYVLTVEKYSGEMQLLATGTFVP